MNIGGSKRKMTKQEAKKLGQLLGHQISKTMEPRMSSGLRGGSMWGDFSKGFKIGFHGTLNPIVKIAKPVSKAVGLKPVGEVLDAVKDVSGEIIGKGMKKKRKRVVSDKMRKRGMLIKKLMKEKGLTLPQASKYIKQNNLL